MAFTVTDYTGVCFPEGETLARVVGKFVVLRHGSDRFAVFAPGEMSVYHANIVERFVGERGVRGTYNPRGDVFYLASDTWAVEGGGHWELDREGGVLGLFGISRAYGRVDLSALAAELREAGAFGHATVLVRP